MSVPSPTPIYRMLHIDNLSVCLKRGGFHGPNHIPKDGIDYKTIHNVEIQETRHIKEVLCGPGGVIHDYVSFYFGPRSPMLFQLHTGSVPNYTDGQTPIIYIASTVQRIDELSLDYIFSDGHGLAQFTQWFDQPDSLDQVDWEVTRLDYWQDTLEDPDRQRRKQAEFLTHQHCPCRLCKKFMC